MTGVAAGFESEPRPTTPRSPMDGAPAEPEVPRGVPRGDPGLGGEREGGAGGQARPAGWLNGAWGPPRMNDR